MRPQFDTPKAIWFESADTGHFIAFIVLLHGHTILTSASLSCRPFLLRRNEMKDMEISVEIYLQFQFRLVACEEKKN